MVLFVGLREISVGDDTVSYVGFFVETTERNFFDFGKLTGEALEPGFLLWMKLISLISSSPRIFLMLTAIATIVPLWYSLYKLAEKPYFAILLVIFLLPIGLYQFMSLMRQGMACGLLALSLTFLAEDRKRPFFLCVLVAGFIHWFAFLFLAGAIMFYIKATRHNFLVFLFVTMVACLIVFPSAEFLTSVFMPKYLYYFENNYNNEQVLGIGSLMILSLEIFALIGNYLRMGRTEKPGARMFLCYGILMCLAFVFLLQMPAFGIYERCAKYFMFFVPFAMSSACSCIKSKTTCMFCEGAIILMGAAYYLYYLGTGYNGMAPYLFL